MIGSLDQRISLQRQTATADGIGGNTFSWSTFAHVWAKVMPAKRGVEAMVEGRMTATELVDFTMYTRADVNELTRIQWRGVPFNVRNVASDSPRNLTMTVTAERGVAS